MKIRIGTKDVVAVALTKDEAERLFSGDVDLLQRLGKVYDVALDASDGRKWAEAESESMTLFDDVKLSYQVDGQPHAVDHAGAGAARVAELIA